MTFEQEHGRNRDSNVKFAPLGPESGKLCRFPCASSAAILSLIWHLIERDCALNGLDMSEIKTPSHRSEHAPLEIRSMLRRSGLRPTRQRLALAKLLYGRGNRHISAEGLHEEAIANNFPVSLATVYNTLHQFTNAGLLRAVAVDGSKTYFDTNTVDHHHFFVEDDDIVIDIPQDRIGMGRVPEPPEGYEISRVDVVVRLRRISR